MKKNLSQKMIGLAFILVLVISACEPKPTATNVESTLQTVVAQTLTAAPTATPLPSPTPTITPTATATPLPVEYGPTNFPDNVDPLTGLEVADPTVLDRRPVMIKVSNYPVSGRPHAGLSLADIVFDYYIGNGANRFVALFYGQDAEKVGPVRSGRMVDSQLVRMYGGVLGMEYAYSTVLNSIVSNLGNRVIYSDHCPALCSDGPVTETSRFANTYEFSALYGSKTSSDNSKQNLDGMSFSSNPPEGGVPATEFTFHYGKNNNALWKYDETTHKYLRFIDEVDSAGDARMIPLVDRNTNEQLSFSNVVVIFTDLFTMNGAADSIHEYKLAGRSGSAMIFRDGMMYEVKWRAYDYTPITFLDENKNPVALQPGNTWMHLTGVYSKIEQSTSDPSVWTVSLRKNN